MPECPSCNTRVAFGAACCTTCGASLPRTNPAPKNAPIYGEKKLIVVNLESVVDMSPAHRIARRQKKKGKAAKKVLRDYMNTFKARPNAKDFLSRLSQRQGALVAFVSDFPESDKSKVADMLRSLALPLSHDDSGVLVFMGSDKAALNRYSSTYTITHYFGPGFRDARKMMVPAAYSSVEDYIGAPANPYLAPPASPGPYTLSGLRPEPTPGSYTLTNPTGKKNCGCGQDPCITYGPQPNPSLDFARKAIENEEAAGSKIEQLKKENEEILALIEELDMEIEKAQFEGKSTVDLQLDKGELVVAHEENLTDISKLQKAMKLSQSTRPEYLRANPPVKPRRQTNKKTGKKRKESAKNYFQRLVSNKKMNEEFPRNDQRVKVALSYVEKEYGKRGVDSVTKSWGPIGNPAMACPLATQDLKVNTRNRDAAVDAEHIQYGPLNLSDDTYWLRYSEKWGTTPEVAKKSNCSNCVAFDISPRMKDCMPGKTSDDEGELGYCWMHHFKCHSARTCYTWAAGGPIVSDETSHDWQRKNQPMKNPSSEGFPIYSAEPKSAKNLGMVTAVVQVGRGVVKDIGEGLQDFYRALIGGRQSMTEKRMMLAVAEMHLDLTNAVKQKGGNAIGNVRLDYEHPTQGGDITLIATADALKIPRKNAPFDFGERLKEREDDWKGRLEEWAGKYIDDALEDKMMGKGVVEREKYYRYEVQVGDQATTELDAIWNDVARHLSGLDYRYGGNPYRLFGEAMEEIKSHLKELYPPSNLVWVSHLFGDEKVTASMRDPESDAFVLDFFYPIKAVSKAYKKHTGAFTVWKNNPPGRPTRDSLKKRLKDLVKDYETVVLGYGAGGLGGELRGELPYGGWEDVEDAFLYDLHEMFGWGAELQNPPSTKKMDKAKKAYKDFNGKDPKEVRTEKVDFGGMLVYLGDCWSIGYRNGKEGFGDDQKYIHEFGVDEETGRTFEEPKLYMTVPDKGKPMLVIKDGAWKIKTDKNGVSWIYY